MFNDMADSNVYELAARQNKVAKLVAVFQRSNGGTSENVANLDDQGWSKAEALAEVNKASAETRLQVIKTLRDAEDYKAAMFNPFAGLPKGTAVGDQIQ